MAHTEEDTSRVPPMQSKQTCTQQGCRHKTRAAEHVSTKSTLTPSTGVQVPKGPTAANVPGQGPVSPRDWEEHVGEAGEGQERT